jgi:hypothetical protein
MPDAAKKPCRICRHWFRPDVHIGTRQHTCSRPECQKARRKKTQAAWRARNPDYFLALRIQARAQCEQPPEPLCLPTPLSKLPWDIAQDEFGIRGADFIGAMGALLLQAKKDQFKGQVVDSVRFRGTLPGFQEKDQFRGQLIDST